MINVFCNSHCFSQLAAFFIGARAERSTTENCICYRFRGLELIIHVMGHNLAEHLRAGDDRQGGLIPIRSPRPAPGHYNLPNSAAVRLRESATFETGSEPFGSRSPSGSFRCISESLYAAGRGRCTVDRLAGMLPTAANATRFRAGTAARSATREVTYAYDSPVQSLVTPTLPSVIV